MAQARKRQLTPKGADTGNGNSAPGSPLKGVDDGKDRPEWAAWNVERRPLKQLVPYARNARTHSPEQVAQIALSIKEWGWTIPVLIDEADGIIAGHGRIMAADTLGIGEVPVLVARGWSEAQKKAYVLADNKLTLNAGWNTDLLKLEIEALQLEGFNIPLIGFSEGETDSILNGWKSDFDPTAKDGENLDGIKGAIRVVLDDRDTIGRAKEIIGAALKEQGIAHELP